MSQCMLCCTNCCGEGMLAEQPVHWDSHAMGATSQGRVVSGHTAALDVVQEAAVKKGALKAARLAVSGAFHTPLMQPARDALVKVQPLVSQPPCGTTSPCCVRNSTPCILLHEISQMQPCRTCHSSQLHS